MNVSDLMGTAVANTFRSKTRTILTTLALFVGAFTLTITNGLGTGINRFIEDTVGSFGASNVMTVSARVDEATATGAAAGEPVEYDPNALDGVIPGFGQTTPVTSEDITAIGEIEGVVSVFASKSVTVDFVQRNGGTPWVIQIANFTPGQTLQVAAGETPEQNSTNSQIAIPESYVDALGFSDAKAAIGQTVTLAVSDATGTQHKVDAEVVGVTEATLAGGGASATLNPALTDELAGLQNAGLSEEEQDRFASVSATYDQNADESEIAAIKDALEDQGLTGSTVEDQLGGFTTVIDAIVMLLNGFAVIALLAASFGIVNTLFMSVQERTREIGLMKAMGMGSGRVFTLFSLEAVFIGFLGSAVGVAAGMGVGGIVSSALADGLFADLPGLTIIAFEPVSIIVTMVVIMLIAFLAGTLPAARAARADPVTSLRYE